MEIKLVEIIGGNVLGFGFDDGRRGEEAAVEVPGTPLPSFGGAPFPVSDFGQVLAVSIDVLLMFDQLVLHYPLQVGPLASNCSTE
jgi:hypothetical protein